MKLSEERRNPFSKHALAAERLKKLPEVRRKNPELTVAQLSARLGLHHSVIAKALAEAGDAAPTSEGWTEAVGPKKGALKRSIAKHKAGR